MIMLLIIGNGSEVESTNYSSCSSFVTYATLLHVREAQS